MRTRRARGIAAGGALLGVLVAAPALAVAGQSADPGGQPPPGTSVAKEADVTVGRQPAAATKVAEKADVVVGRQPVNRHPKQAGPPVGLRHSKNDRGAKGLAPTRDGGKKNAPVTRG